jgi:hypothetical protein
VTNDLLWLRSERRAERVRGRDRAVRVEFRPDLCDALDGAGALASGELDRAFDPSTGKIGDFHYLVGAPS